MDSYSFKTIFGWITIRSINSKLVCVKIGRSKNLKKNKYLLDVSKQIKLFFLGKIKEIKLDYRLIGTPMQINIWKELAKIKYGKTTSYGAIARKFQTSPRYVGNVCGQNKLLVIIPCHRVIKSDGSIGGFSGLGGVKFKKKLLNLETNV